MRDLSIQATKNWFVSTFSQAGVASKAELIDVIDDILIGKCVVCGSKEEMSVATFVHREDPSLSFHPCCTSCLPCSCINETHRGSLRDREQKLKAAILNLN